MQITIDIIKENKCWKEQKFITKNKLKTIFTSIFIEVGKFANCSKIETALLLTDDKKIAELNKDFRNKDKATNVLSFPDVDRNWRDLTNEDFASDVILGDIAMSFATIDMEAKNYNISFENHFTHLLVHAILHLIGYDHKHDDDAKVMIELEIKILQNLNISIPPIYG